MTEINNKILYYGMLAKPNRDKILINLDKIKRDNFSPLKTITVLIHEQKHMMLNPLIFNGKLKNFVDSLSDNQKDDLDAIRQD